MLNVTPEKKHMVRKKTCGCKICKYNNDPVDLRIVRKHIQKYGLHVEKFEDSTYSDCQNSDSRQCPVEVRDRPPSEPDVDNEPLSSLSEVGHGSEDDEVPEQVNTSNQSGSESETENESEMESESEMEEEANSLESEWCSKYDTTLYEADIAVKKIFHTNLTLLEWLTLQFDMFSSHTMSKSMFTHNLKVQKLIHGDTENLLPSSYYQARRLVDPFIIKKKVFSVCVNDCVLFRDSSKYSYKHLDKCPVCGEDRYVKSTTKRLIPKRKFIYIPIGPRIGRMFGDVNLSQLVLSHPGNNYQSEQGTDKDMWDVHHSSTWNEVYSAEGYFKGNKSGLSYAIELDGVNPFHSIGVRYSMTPIMLTLLNLPRHVRNSFGNINLVGIIPCNGKSESVNMDPFLEVLVDELLYLTGCKAYCAYYKAPVNIKIKLLLYILDYPGLSKVFHQHGSGSLLGCHWCLIRGKRCSHLDKVIYLSNRSYLQKADPIRKDTVHFLDQKEDKSGKPEPRSIETESSYRMAYEKAKNKAQAACVATSTGCKKRLPAILSSRP